MQPIDVEPIEVQTAMAAAIEEVLETMCFTLVLSSEPLPGALSSSEITVPEPDDGDPLIAMLRFEGSPSGEFRLSIPPRLARAVGSCFLGSEPDEVSDSQAAEVVCELANMFCGSVLSRLEAKTIFHLAHPELVPPCRPSNINGFSRKFELEEGFFSASLAFQQGL